MAVSVVKILNVPNTDVNFVLCVRIRLLYTSIKSYLAQMLAQMASVTSKNNVRPAIPTNVQKMILTLEAS